MQVVKIGQVSPYVRTVIDFFNTNYEGYHSLCH